MYSVGVFSVPCQTPGRLVEARLEGTWARIPVTGGGKGQRVVMGRSLGRQGGAELE